MHRDPAFREPVPEVFRVLGQTAQALQESAKMRQLRQPEIILNHFAAEPTARDKAAPVWSPEPREESPLSRRQPPGNSRVVRRPVRAKSESCGGRSAW